MPLFRLSASDNASQNPQGDAPRDQCHNRQGQPPAITVGERQAHIRHGFHKLLQGVGS
jgi:hypothetical protein